MISTLNSMSASRHLKNAAAVRGGNWTERSKAFLFKLETCSWAVGVNRATLLRWLAAEGARWAGGVRGADR